jgi:hypothetical protein
MIVLQGNLSICSLRNMVLFEKIFEKSIFGQLTLKYYQKTIYFHPFHWMKKNSGKGSNPRSLGCKWN